MGNIILNSIPKQMKYTICHHAFCVFSVAVFICTCLRWFFLHCGETEATQVSQISRDVLGIPPMVCVQRWATTVDRCIVATIWCLGIDGNIKNWAHMVQQLFIDYLKETVILHTENWLSKYYTSVVFFKLKTIPLWFSIH